jgi:ech hydrogenase subunit A
LLFLCVGVVEHKIHSRDIEDMSGLIITMPKLSVMMQIGMAGMFLAPFGMLISKWAAMKALIDSNALLVVFVVFGSAVTLLFWVKWMGKLLQITKPGAANVENGISGGEWTALGSLAVMTVGACLFFPLLSSRLVDPYVQSVCKGVTMDLGAGNIIIMLIMLGMVALFPLSFLHYGRKVRVADPYLAGANTAGGVKFTGSAGAVHEMGMKNYYLEPWFGENRLFMPGALVSALLIALMMIEVMCK